MVVSLPSCSSWFICMQMWGHSHLPCPNSLAAALTGVLYVLAARPTCLDECFFFNSLVVGLPYSLIFWPFWLFFYFKFVVSFFWLCEEAKYIYLYHHLGQKLPNTFFKKKLLRFSCQCFPRGLLWCYDLYLSLLPILNLFMCIV